MKICLYLEYYHFLGGVLFKKIGTGLLSSYRNQKTILKNRGIPFTEKWSDDCDILQINTPWLKSIWLMKRARLAGKKVIVWSHVTAEDTQGVFKLFKYFFGPIKWYLTRAYNMADIILSPSEYTKGLLTAYGINPNKIVVQSNGVDLTKIYYDLSRGIQFREIRHLEGKVIGTVGLVIPRKGIDTFIEMAQNHPNQKFIWYGKIYGSLMVDALPKNLPPNLTFSGFVDDILGAFNSIDIFVFPSYEENQGMAPIEAAAVGLPIIVRDLPVYNGWLENGVNCLKAKNSAEFNACLDRLLTDKDLVEKIRSGAKALAERESLGVLGEKLVGLYSRLSSKNHV